MLYLCFTWNGTPDDSKTVNGKFLGSCAYFLHCAIQFYSIAGNSWIRLTALKKEKPDRKILHQGESQQLKLKKICSSLYGFVENILPKYLLPVYGKNCTSEICSESNKFKMYGCRHMDEI